MGKGSSDAHGGGCCDGRKLPDAAKWFSIGVSSVVRWAQRFRRTGSVAAKLAGALVAAAPDLPLHDITRGLAARNVRVGYGTIWRFFAKEKITFKKIVRAAEQDRPDIAAERIRCAHRTTLDIPRTAWNFSFTDLEPLAAQSRPK